MKPTPMTLADLRLRTYELSWRGSKAEDTAMRNSAQVVELLGPEMPVAKLTADDVQRLVLTLKRKGNATSTVNRKLGALSLMLTHALNGGHVEKRIHIPHLVEPEPRERVLDEVEEAALLDWLERAHLSDSRAICIVLLDTGLRLAELLGRPWSDITLYPPAKAFIRLPKTKGGKPRTVPLTDRARRELVGMSTVRGSARGPFAHMPARTFQTHFAAARAALGLEDDPEFVPHALRHTCATRLVQRGASIPTVQRWMGHARVATTMRYAHASDVDLAAARKLLEAG